MDKLVEHGIRMLEIVEGENDFFRNDAKRQADIARAVYDTILRVQALEHKADRKTENCSEIPNNCEDEQMETQTETQNSNLTFEKVMEEIQTQVIEFPDTHQKFTFARKIEMDGDSIKIGGWEYKGVKDGEREGE